MAPTWEAINALATALSAIIVTIAVVLGYRQLRVTAEQLRALRLATQLDGTMRIFDDLNTEEFRVARRFVSNELAERMQDEQFRYEVGRIGLADEHDHRELTVLRGFEKIGTYVRHGVLEGALIYDYGGPWIVSSWESLTNTGVVALHRTVLGPTLWENFEWLDGEARRFMTTRGADPVRYADPFAGERSSGPPPERRE